MKKSSKRHSVKFELGDLVKVGDIWNMMGVVRADSRSWWVIKDHYDVNHCIVHRNDIVKVVKKQAVPRKYLRYLR